MAKSISSLLQCYKTLLIAALLILPMTSLAQNTEQDKAKAQSQAANKAQQTILIMGDSLSAAHNIQVETSWPTLLSQKVSRQYPSWQVVNASISGETTAGGAARLPALAKRYQPDICVIELGANDGLRGQSLKRMRHNLSRMIKLCQQTGKVLLLGIWLPPNYGEKYTNAFKASYPKLAKQQNTAIVPFFLDGVAGVEGMLQADGLHPVSKAQPIILNNVWPNLEVLIKAVKND